MNPDGVLFSNGPGDPSAVPYAVETVKQILGKVPVFGICMGHQLLGQALGGKTFKMKFGHHGGNHPVRNLRNGRVEISSQVCLPTHMFNYYCAQDCPIPSNFTLFGSLETDYSVGQCFILYFSHCGYALIGMFDVLELLSTLAIEFNLLGVEISILM